MPEFRTTKLNDLLQLPKDTGFQYDGRFWIVNAPGYARANLDYTETLCMDDIDEPFDILVFTRDNTWITTTSQKQTLKKRNWFQNFFQWMLGFLSRH